MKTFLRILPFTLILLAALAGCVGESLRMDPENNQDPAPNLRVSGPVQFTVDASEATREISAASLPDLAIGLTTDAVGTSTAIANRKLAPAPVAAPIEEQVVEEFELIGSLSVVPGPPVDELQDLLTAEFDRLGIDPARTVASAPAGPENSVLDLQVTLVDPDGGGPQVPTGIELRWTEVLVGDYDQNSEVGISDLTSLGQKFLGTVTYAGGKPAGDPDEDGGSDPPLAGTGADNWRLARIDGDANGEISISDITPIASHFQQSLSGYRVYRKGPGEADYSLLANPMDPGSEVTVPRSAAYMPGQTRVDPNRPVRYSFAENLNVDGQYSYYVAAFDIASAGQGVNSNTVSQNFATIPPNNDPVADLTADVLTGLEPLTVNFDASGSTDSDGTINSYEWDWDNDLVYDENTGATATNSHIFNEGNHTVNLRVTDDKFGWDTASVNLVVTSIPSGDLFLEALDGIGMTPADLTFANGTLPAQIDFSGAGYRTYGNDATLFVDQAVPGSRFGGYTNYWHTDHTALPTWSETNSDAIAGTTGFEDLITEANDIFFEGDSRQTFWGDPDPGTDYVPAGTDPLATAVIDLITNQGGTPDSGTITTDAADVPTELQNALATLLLAADEAATARSAFLVTFFGDYDPLVIPEENIWHIAYNSSHAFRVPITNNFIWPFQLFGLATDDGGATWTASNRPFAGVWSYEVFAQAAVNLAHALDQVNATLTGGGIAGTFSFDQDTPIGRILVNSGDGDTVYADGSYLLICDVEGNDTYNCPAGANADIFNGVSLNLDLAGNDTYTSLDDPMDVDGFGNDIHSQQGTGRLGVGYLVDYAGDDQYDASMTSQGSAILGWGLLYDAAGNDTYTGVRNVQGAGLCGVGILHDVAGMDQYNAYHRSQGYGDVWGLGILSDAGPEGDVYTAEWDGTTGLDIPVIAADDVYLSYCQGAAAGRGIEPAQDPPVAPTFPILWEGGVGMLVDSGGDDSYTCGAYGQGASYWFGTGVLDDRGGNDEYDGYLTTQGAAFQLSCGILTDRSGDDDYNGDAETRGLPIDGRMMGACFDSSVSWLLDGDGADTYVAPPQSLGTGVVSGWSYFIDMGTGVDSYTLFTGATNEQTLGRGLFGNDTNATFGLFIDCGGSDTYDGAYATIPSGSIGDVSAGNDTRWFRFGYDTDDPNGFHINEFGTGIDGDGTTGFEF